MTGLTPYQIGLLAAAVQEAYHRDDGERLEELGLALLAEGRRRQAGHGPTPDVHLEAQAEADVDAEEVRG